MNADLIAALRARGAELSKRAIAEMYRRPFWRERFGDRGRRHSDDDGRHHVSYLVEALEAKDPEIMRRYSRWLQPVLTTRGMCTRHLDENFELLGRVIREDLGPADDALEYLQAAREALIYPDGLGRELQLVAGVLVKDVVLAPHVTPEDADDLVSYLADAAALARVDLFAAHAQFLDGYVRRHTAHGNAVGMLAAAGAAVKKHPGLSQGVRGSVERCLASALSQVAA